MAINVVWRGHVSPALIKVCDATLKYDGLTVGGCAKAAGVSPKTARKWLDYLVGEGALEVYRQQYRPNVIARVYVNVGVKNGA